MTPVIDAHVTEPRDVWSSRLPKRYVDAGPTMVRDDDGGDMWTMGGKSLGTVGVMLPWALDRLRHHLGQMLAGAGAEPQMVSVDGERVGHLVDQVASLATA
jgi:hypothetical protein